MAWNTLYMRPKSPTWICFFADHLSDSFLKPLEFISYLKVICAQSWGLKEPIWDLRSPKMSSQQAHSWIRMKKNTLYVFPIFRHVVFDISRHKLLRWQWSPAGCVGERPGGCLGQAGTVWEQEEKQFDILWSQGRNPGDTGGSHSKSVTNICWVKKGIYMYV